MIVIENKVAGLITHNNGKMRFLHSSPIPPVWRFPSFYYSIVPSGGWQNESNAVDGNINTYAINNTPNYPLELFADDASTSNKLLIKAGTVLNYPCKVTISCYREGNNWAIDEEILYTDYTLEDKKVNVLNIPKDIYALIVIKLTDWFGAPAGCLYEIKLGLAA